MTHKIDDRQMAGGRLWRYSRVFRMGRGDPTHRLCRPDDLHGLLWRTGVYPPLDLHAEGDEVYRVRRQSKKTAEDSQKVILLVQR